MFYSSWMERERMNMDTNELKLRMEAIRRLLSGESASSIGRALGKSPRWVSYWGNRYDPDDPVGSLQNHSSRPKQPHTQWPEMVKQQVLHSRCLRVAAQPPGYQYALVGAEAIHYELLDLGVTPTPPVRTIHYWLKQAGLTVRSLPTTRPDPAAKAYPAPACAAINELHQLDLKGPVYLVGQPQKYYLLALRDFRSKAVALAAAQDRQSATISDFLVAAWQRLGLPQTLQMDNGLELRGSNRYPRSFGKVVRLSLDVGVAPLFIPPHEPWRNGFIENFNGQMARLLLDHDHFSTYAELQAGAARLESAVNTTHRLTALEGQTPNEFRADKSIRFLAPDYDWRQHDLQLRQGTIAFIRLVRKSGRITLHADDKLDIAPALHGQYVLARVHVADKTLLIYHNEQAIKQFAF